MPDVINYQRLSYSITQAMEALGLSRQTLYNEINAGRLRTYSVGSRRFISHEAITTWIRNREAEQPITAIHEDRESA
jgi:excisionase family DNA binding protein